MVNETLDKEKLLKSRYMLINQMCKSIDLDILCSRLCRSGASVDECRRYIEDFKNLGNKERVLSTEEQVKLQDPRLFGEIKA